MTGVGVVLGPSVGIINLDFEMMAKQEGFIMLEGSLGDLTYYKRKGLYLTRKKGSMSKERMATEPCFEKARENSSEFGTASTAGKLIRTVFGSVLLKSFDKDMNARLSAKMLQVVKSDSVNVPGRRKVVEGKIGLLKGFEFNKNKLFASTFCTPYSGSIDRDTGELAVVIPSFMPMGCLDAPEGATHFKIVSAGAEIDFESGEFMVHSLESGLMGLDVVTGDVRRVHWVDGGGFLVLVLGVRFYGFADGEVFGLKGSGVVLGCS